MATDVNYVQNFTDVDDKIIDRRQSAGDPGRDLADQYIGEFYADMAALNVKPATAFVRATSEIDEIIRIIAGADREGLRLRGRRRCLLPGSRDEGLWQALASHRWTIWRRARGSRSTSAKRRRWTSPSGSRPSRASRAGRAPWGAGRPGWHIECSAIVARPARPPDRHSRRRRGPDLPPPRERDRPVGVVHRPGALRPYWMHNGLLQLGGEKMSKSLGNLVTIKEALEEFSADAHPPVHADLALPESAELQLRGRGRAERAVARLRAAVTPRPTGEPAGEHAELAQARPPRSTALSRRWTTTSTPPAASPSSTSSLGDQPRPRSLVAEAGSPRRRNPAPSGWRSRPDTRGAPATTSPRSRLWICSSRFGGSCERPSSSRSPTKSGPAASPGDCDRGSGRRYVWRPVRRLSGEASWRKNALRPVTPNAAFADLGATGPKHCERNASSSASISPRGPACRASWRRSFSWRRTRASRSVCRASSPRSLERGGESPGGHRPAAAFAYQSLDDLIAAGQHLQPCRLFWRSIPWKTRRTSAP